MIKFKKVVLVTLLVMNMSAIQAEEADYRDTLSYS